MTIRKLPAAVLILAAAAFLNGCGGSSGPAAKPAVGLSVLAPTSGSTVGVRDVTVAGTVSPATATVLVGGRPAHVIDGRYSRNVQIANSSQTITITGQADGYAPGTASTTVQYSTRLGSVLAAAHLGQLPGSRAATNSGAKPKANVKSHHKAAAHKPAPKPAAKPASQPAPAATPVSSPTTKPSPSPAPTNSKPASKAHKASKTHSSKNSDSKQSKSKRSKSKQSKSKRSSKTTRSRHKSGKPTRSSKPTLTVADIKRLWIRGCVKAGKGNDYVSYCNCTYAHLEAAGALRTRERLLALARSLDRYARTQNFARLPRYVRMAMSTCASKLPPLDPVTGPPKITKLPGLSHSEASTPSSPTTPPAAAPTETTPAPPTSTTPPVPPTTTVSNTQPDTSQVVSSTGRRTSHRGTRDRAGHRRTRAGRSLLSRTAMHNIDLALRALVRYRPAAS